MRTLLSLIIIAVSELFLITLVGYSSVKQSSKDEEAVAGARGLMRDVALLWFALVCIPVTGFVANFSEFQDYFQLSTSSAVLRAQDSISLADVAELDTKISEYNAARDSKYPNRFLRGLFMPPELDMPSQLENLLDTVN